MYVCEFMDYAVHEEHAKSKSMVRGAVAQSERIAHERERRWAAAGHLSLKKTSLALSGSKSDFKRFLPYHFTPYAYPQIADAGHFHLHQAC